MCETNLATNFSVFIRIRWNSKFDIKFCHQFAVFFFLESSSMYCANFQVIWWLHCMEQQMHGYPLIFYRSRDRTRHFRVVRCLWRKQRWRCPLVISVQLQGNSIGSPLSRKFGCQRVILACGIPKIVSIPMGNAPNKIYLKVSFRLQVFWLLTIHAQNPYYLYGTSVLGGLTGAFQVVCMPMFVMEISQDKYAWIFSHSSESL